jgi:predicted enzyme related to lactoylglutathione lyase
MAVIGLNNLIIVGSDVSKSARFYTEALGLDLAFVDGDRWAQMKAGTAKVGISSAEEAGLHQGGAIPVFEIDDIEATRSAILLAGGEVVSERDMGSHGYALTVRDPDGNVLQLIKR